MLAQQSVFAQLQPEQSHMLVGSMHHYAAHRDDHLARATGPPGG